MLRIRLQIVQIDLAPILLPRTGLCRIICERVEEQVKAQPTEMDPKIIDPQVSKTDTCPQIISHRTWEIRERQIRECHRWEATWDLLDTDQREPIQIRDKIMVYKILRQPGNPARDLASTPTSNHVCISNRKARQSVRQLSIIGEQVLGSRQEVRPVVEIALGSTIGV